MTPSTFSFQEYAREQFEEIKDILRGMSTQYMPREEINLRFSEILKAQANITETLVSHAATIERLKEATNNQTWTSMSRSRFYASLGVYSASIITIALWIMDRMIKYH